MIYDIRLAVRVDDSASVLDVMHWLGRIVSEEGQEPLLGEVETLVVVRRDENARPL